MAGVNSKSKGQYDLEMTCCLGDHPLNNPKLLPCHHSFCTECIKAKVRPDEKDFTCPKCQLPIPLTEKVVDKLPDNVLFHILQEARGGNAECVMCKFENKKSPGTFQCLDCSEITCDECKPYHTKTALTRLHRLVSLKEIKDGKYKSEIQSAKQLICDTHSKQNKPMLLDYYCEDCKCLVCLLCAFKEHQPQGHACKTVDEIHNDKTTAVTDLVLKLLDLERLDEEFAGVLEKSEGQNKELQEKLENEVYQRATQFIEVIEKVKDDKLEQIRCHYQTENSSIQVKLNVIQNRTTRIDSHVSYTQGFLEHSSKAEFLQHENEMMKTLQYQAQQNYDRTLTTNVLEVDEPKVEELEAFITQAFGKVRIEKQTLGTPSGIDIPRELMEEPMVLFNEGLNGGIGWDLTVATKGDIIVVGGSTIQVYNSEGVPKERINCSQILDAWNVVAKGDTLYISNQEVNGNTLVIDFKGNLKKTITLPQTGQIYSNKGLAVDDEDNVYISSYGTHSIYKCKVNETKAKVFKQRGTDPDLIDPVYLTMTSNDELVVSNNSLNTVQVYDRNSEFLWQYKGQGDNKLYHPHGVCCDMDGYIYIASYSRNIIEIIKDGMYQKTIKSDDFSHPNGIVIDKDRNVVITYDCGRRLIKFKVWK